MFRSSVRAALVLAVAFATMAVVPDSNAESSALSREEMSQMVGANHCDYWQIVSGCTTTGCVDNGSNWVKYTNLGWTQIVESGNGYTLCWESGSQNICRIQVYSDPGCTNLTETNYFTQPGVTCNGIVCN